MSVANLSEQLKDTVNDAASLNVSVLGKVELDKLAEATGVIVVHGLSIPKGFHDGTADRGKAIKHTKPLHRKLVLFFFTYPVSVNHCELLSRYLSRCFCAVVDV